LEARETTRPLAADRLKDRVAVLDARLPCADTCDSFIEQMQTVNRRGEP
jgi:hypothetical protein